eukprot:gene5353-6024_t
MDPNTVHRQFLPGYPDPTGWSNLIYNYGGQAPATSQLHDLRAEQQRAITERQQISGHEIVEFFARNVAQAPTNILNDCHLQPQPPSQQQVDASTPHDVVIDLGLNACVSNKKPDKSELSFIQDATERSKFDKRKLKSLKASLKAWYKRTGCVTVALTCLDGQVFASGPDHMMSLSGNQDFKNIFMNTLTSYDQLSRLADIVSNCNEGDNVPDPTIDPGPVRADDIDTGGVIEGMEKSLEEFTQANQRQSKNKGLVVGESGIFDQSCKFCPEKFTSKHFLKKHMFEAHNSSTERLACPFCNKLFMTRWKLDRHTISHTGAKPYNCIYCPKRFAEKNKLITHVKSHKESFVDPQAIERLVASLLPKRKTTHDCMVCRKSFLSSWKLKRHVRVHSGEKPFKCSKCGKSFIEKSKLDQHEQLPHDENGKTRGAGEGSGGASTERKHSCDKCNKKFISLWKLRRHERFHTGERPYQCEQCDKGFVEKNKLTMHIKYFHTDKSALDGSDVVLPRKINRVKKYECEDCQKRFTTQWKLRRHSQTHSTARPYRCEECKRGFLTKNKLDLHNFTFHYQQQSGQEQQQSGNATEKLGNAGHAVEAASEDSIAVTASASVAKQGSLTLPEMVNQTSVINTDQSNQTTSAVVASSSIDKPAVDVFSNNALVVTDPSVIGSDVGMNPVSGQQQDDGTDPQQQRKTAPKRMHVCGICAKEFATAFRLKRHVAIHSDKKQATYACTLCSKDFGSKEALVNHVVNHGAQQTVPTESTSSGETAAASKDELANDGQAGTPGKHTCFYCGKRFISPWKLNRHLTVHTGNKPYFCKACGKAFAEKNKLDSHQKAAHSIDAATVHQQPMIMMVDGGAIEGQSTQGVEIFTSQSDLQAHIVVLHQDKSQGFNAGATTISATALTAAAAASEAKKSLKYLCQVCNKGFITPSKLKRHGFSHGKEKPFKCSKCNKSFSENNKLFNHLMKHDKPRAARTGTKRNASKAVATDVFLGGAGTRAGAKVSAGAGIGAVVPINLKSVPVSGQPLKAKIVPIETILSSGISLSGNEMADYRVASDAANIVDSLQHSNTASMDVLVQPINATPSSIQQMSIKTSLNSSQPTAVVADVDVAKSNSEKFKSLVDRALSNTDFDEIGKGGDNATQVRGVKEVEAGRSNAAQGERNEINRQSALHNRTANPAGNILQCHVCSKQFDRNDALLMHIKEHGRRVSENE